MRRALLVGAGGMGRAWAKNLAAHPEVELAGWVDIRPGAAESAARELRLEVAHCGTGFEEAIPIVAPEFVVDVTPPEVHREITVAALGRGIPVLGEKPMAGSMEQARAMVAAADRAGKLYMVSQSRRYIAEQTAFRRAILDQLGPLGILNADFFIGAHFGGFRDAMASPLVLDMAIHTFDQARFLSGRDPISIYAEEFNPSWSWYRGDACATALFEMEGGLRHVPRKLVCRGAAHELGRRLARGRPQRVGEVGGGLGAGGSDREEGGRIPQRHGGVFAGRGSAEGRHRGVAGGVPRGSWGRTGSQRRVPRQHQEPGDGVRGHSVLAGGPSRAHRGSAAACGGIIQP